MTKAVKTKANPLLERLKKASKSEFAESMDNSTILNTSELAKTDIPALNVALSGSLDGGLGSGLTIFAGQSAVFKSMFTLICAKAYLDKYDDAVMLFYDSEMGSSKKYFEAIGIDTSRVLYVPVTDVEALKFDIMSQLEEIKRGDHVVIVVDSIGNLASKKEVQDTLDEKSVADMTRAKQLKSLTRMITPHLNVKDIPAIMVCHVYQELGMFPKVVLSGGCLEKGSLIKMSNGTVRTIEEVHENEQVVSKDGSRKVLRTWNPDTLDDGHPECLEIEFEDGSRVVCSEDHKFLYGGNWISAKILKGMIDKGIEIDVESEKSD